MRCALLSVVMPLVTVALGSVARGEIVTVRFDAPAAPLGVFGLQWTGDYADPAKIGTIAGARFHAEFNSVHPAGSLPDAADVLFQMQLPTTTLPFWDFRGADLGWAGSGAFTGDISTDAFNGQELLVDPGVPLSSQMQLWFARILSEDPDHPQLGGVLTDAYWEFDLNVVPSPASWAALAGAWMLRRRRRRADGPA